MTRWTTTVGSPVGVLYLVADTDGRLTHLLFDDETRFAPLAPAPRPDPAPFTAAVAQLGEYFAGDRRDFDLPLAPVGTPFQQAVWQVLRTIPFGETRSYAAQAVALGRPSAVRAAAAANGRNPIGIVVPCHRVIGTDGSLTGYGGGLWRKRWLLGHEQAAAGAVLFAGAT